MSYNFLIGQDGAGLSTSAFDASGAVNELEDVGETLPPSSGPGVLIKVLDRESNGERLFTILRAVVHVSHLRLGLRSVQTAAQQDAARPIIEG